MSLTWLLITWLSLPGILASSAEQWLKRSAYLDPDRMFFMEWGNGDQEDIYIKLTVRTLGYVALGFSRRGTMVDSDIVVGWIANDQVHLQDRNAEGNQMPELDHTQDYELISGCENATHTTLFFRRKWNTCDPQDFTLEYDNTIRVMYAYSSEDPVDETNIHFHEGCKKGWRSFMLLQPETPREKNVEFLDWTTNDFTVSKEWNTKYWCKLFKVPQWGKKHHITTVEALIEGGNQGHVHHVVIFNCPAPKPTEYDQHLNKEGYDCHDDNSPAFTRECVGFFTGWSVGGEGVVFPEHFGFPLFPDIYMMLEIHYDNFDRISGLPGRTGLRLHHTPNLRQFDGALLEVGIDVGSNVMAPPGIPDFVIAGHSNSECMGPVIPPKGVKLSSAYLHTHLIGSGVKTRHFRNNIELPTLVDNNNYDPLYQNDNKFPEERLFLPGDQLSVECTYDSTNRTTTTMGGFSTREEMCISFIVYYPRIEGLHTSSSLPKLSSVRNLLGSKELDRLTTGRENYDQAFVDFMTRYDWNRTSVRRFEDEIRFSGQDPICRLGAGTVNIQTNSSYPEGFYEYAEQPQCDEMQDQ